MRSSRLVVEASMWILLAKGLALVPVTIWTFVDAYRRRRATPAVGIVSCAAGTFALSMACLAAWIRTRLPLDEDVPRSS